MFAGVAGSRTASRSNSGACRWPSSSPRGRFTVRVGVSKYVANLSRLRRSRPRWLQLVCRAWLHAQHG